MKRLFLSLLWLLCCTHIALAAIATPTKDAVALRKEIDAITNQLELDYRINIFTDYVPRASWGTNGVAASPDDLSNLREYVIMLDEELRKYSPRFIHNTHLGAIVLVKDLALVQQRRAAIPEYSRQILWLDFKNYRSRVSYERHVIHHEFYHMIEFELHGNAYWKDPEWSALNDPSFNYGQGGNTAYVDKSKSWAYITHPQPGFINMYSMTGLEEDKAEIFAALWMKSEREQILQWAQTDAILRAKIAYFKREIRELDDTLNEDYWNRLDEVKLLVAPTAFPAEDEVKLQ